MGWAPEEKAFSCEAVRAESGRSRGEIRFVGAWFSLRHSEGDRGGRSAEFRDARWIRDGGAAIVASCSHWMRLMSLAAGAGRVPLARAWSSRGCGGSEKSTTRS